MNRDGAMALLFVETVLNGEKSANGYEPAQIKEYEREVKEKFNGEFLGCFRISVNIEATDKLKEKYKVSVGETDGFPAKLRFSRDLNMAKYLEAPEYSLFELFAVALEDNDWFQMGCILSEQVVYSVEGGDLSQRGKADCLHQLKKLVDGWKQTGLWEQLWLESGILEVDGADLHCCLVIKDKEVIKEFLMDEKAGRLVSVLDAKIDQFEFKN